MFSRNVPGEPDVSTILSPWIAYRSEAAGMVIRHSQNERERVTVSRHSETVEDDYDWHTGSRRYKFTAYTEMELDVVH
jgi:hypothetical protein